MLFVYYGDDVTKLRTEALKKAGDLMDGEGAVEIVTPETGNEALLKDALNAASLFRPHEVWVWDTLSKDEELYTAAKELVLQCAESKNIFVIIEEKLSVKDEKIFKAHATEMTSYTRPALRDFNIFALTDALCTRDKKSLWILLSEAWQAGKSSEEIIGTLMWQLKVLRLVAVSGSPDEAQLKPFVYEKAKRGLKKFTLEELVDRSHALVTLYHDGHTGRRDLDRSLEAWVLRL